jgi:HK97 family phage portal protein
MVGANRVGELIVLPSKDTEIVTNDLLEPVIYLVDYNGKKIKYAAEDVLHIKFPNIVANNNKDRIRGLSPLEVLEAVYTASNNIHTAEASIFENRGVSEILTNDSDQPIIPEQDEQLQKEWRQANAGATNFGAVRITNARLRLLKMGMSPEDLRLIESDVTKLRIICAVYGVASSLFNDVERSTFNNVETATRNLHLDVCIPLAKNYVVDEFNRWLFNPVGLTLRLDMDAIQAIKTVDKDTSAKVLSELNAGILSQDEAKKILYPKGI